MKRGLSEYNQQNLFADIFEEKKKPEEEPKPESKPAPKPETEKKRMGAADDQRRMGNILMYDNSCLFPTDGNWYGVKDGNPTALARISGTIRPGIIKTAEKGDCFAGLGKKSYC
jgi:hypothetical protein